MVFVQNASSSSQFNILLNTNANICYAYNHMAVKEKCIN